MICAWSVNKQKTMNSYITPFPLSLQSQVLSDEHEVVFKVYLNILGSRVGVCVHHFWSST